MKSFLISIILCLFLISDSNSQTKIAYVSTDNSTGLLQVFSMNIDGSDKRQLSRVPFNCMFPRWSPNGNQIVFRTDDGRIYLIEDANSDQVTDAYFVFGGDNPIFSPTGEEILFSGDHKNITSLYVMLPTDTDADMITDIDFATQHVISKDGRYIVFSGFEGGSKCIFIMDVEDESDDYIKRISINNNANLEPDISSDNQKFVYASFDNNLKGTIFIFENGSERPLTQGMPSSSQPKFSPDDKRIGFVTIEDNGIHFNVMNTDGSNKKKFNVNGGNIGIFRWIDNETIVYDAERNNNYSIGTLNVVTGDNKIIASAGLNLHPDVITK